MQIDTRQKYALQSPHLLLVCFHHTGHIAKKLEAIQNRFLWGDLDSRRRYHLVCWQEVKRPIRWGGLGLRSITTMNKALHGKRIWRHLVDDNSLWKRIVETKWMRTAKPDNLNTENRSHIISLWKGIMSMFKNMLVNMHWEVGRGDSIKFWQDIWCGDRSLINRLPRIFAIAQNRNLLIRNALCASANGAYSVTISRNVQDWELAEFENFLQLMAKSQLHDRMINYAGIFRQMAFSLSAPSTAICPTTKQCVV